MATRDAPRGRRLTLAFRPSPPSPEASVEAGGSGGSRFSCLGADDGSSDEEASPAVGVAMALEVLGHEDEGMGWTPVARRKRKTEAELVQEFWVDAGFPTPASRYWERRSSTSPEPRDSSCRNLEGVTVVRTVPGDARRIGLPGWKRGQDPGDAVRVGSIGPEALLLGHPHSLGQITDN